MGAIHSLAHFTAKYGVDETLYVEDLPGFIDERTGTGGKDPPTRDTTHLTDSAYSGAESETRTPNLCPAVRALILRAVAAPHICACLLAHVVY